MSTRTGKLVYNYKENRYGIADTAKCKWLYDGLHCGVTMEVYDPSDGTWTDDRVEFDGDRWYLVFSKLRGSQLEGLTVRF